ncbi:MAG: TusE/DsrC/DsvC family sulfur relay protein [Thiothrix sp.]|jgi:tRNA 2-thiouridine synthesizing protein E|uniref:TusE/DsrC/DsvC family sulfur relay protein n=1 Tax=Thiothrix sp. TaxID=1032 RepID=UPI002614EE37|nr:TusE/DsrC/DsvC family sulfur relay protein [Thiothrix sp.]MDD5394438.1 TusE/DsrC/DsvC family sulfur relay protein [Thiothrix sp.]
MMFSNVTLDEMFPRALPVMRAPLPILKTENIYNRIRKHAAAQGIALTDEHMEAINFVLDFYEHCDDCQNARALADMLQAEFSTRGGRKYLYQLFPNGPLSTIHDLADLPNLGHETDKSFGTRW